MLVHVLLAFQLKLTNESPCKVAITASKAGSDVTQNPLMPLESAA